MSGNPSPRKSPSWWPEGEPWPPAHSPNRRYWHSVRGRFFQRVGCAFFFILLATVLIVTTVLVLEMGRRHDFIDPIRTLPVFLRALGVLVFFSILVGFFFVGRELRSMAAPVGDLLDAAGKVADGDYSVRVEERGPGEISALASAFNSMTDKLKTNDEQRRVLLADISHELRTPLTIIQGNLEGMLDGIYPADTRTIQSVLEETRTMARVIDDLRTLSLAESGTLKLQFEQVDLGELVEDTIEAYRSHAAAQQVRLVLEAPPTGLPPLDADPTRIREVLSNLLANALRYTPAEGTITLGYEQTQDAPQMMRVTVSDDGAGISPEDLPHIFDRFYKTHDSNGTGLGLAICKSLVAAHHGEISARSRPGQGTEITFTLPL